MTDNVTFQDDALATPPDATVVATDDVGGVHYQRMKLVDGTDGETTAAKVTAEGNVQTITPNRTASGTLDALDEAVTLSADGSGFARFQMAASDLAGTVVIEGSSDGGTTWVGQQLIFQVDGFPAISNDWDDPVTGYEFGSPLGGLTDVRLRVSAYASGSASVVASVSADGGPALQGAVVYDNDGNVAKVGGGTENQALRVTIASDSTGVLSIDDNGTSLTVDGTVAVTGVSTAANQTTEIGHLAAIETAVDAIQAGQLPDSHNVTVDNASLAITAAALPLPSGAATSALQTQPGVDIGDVTVNNAAGAAAVNVQDGGNSLTVDGTVGVSAVGGTVAVTQSGTWDEVGINDSGNSITVDPQIKETYYFTIPSQVHVNSASTVHWDLFNADAALIVRVISIRQIPNITTAVTGIVFDWLLERTTAVGTGGTGLTAWLADLSGTALDADITARSKPSGGATQSTDLFNYSLSSEETNAATIMVASLGGLELVPQPSRDTRQGIVLRQNQGLRCVQVTASAAGNTGWLIGFTVE